MKKLYISFELYMKADSVKPASLGPKLGNRYIFYIMIYNGHLGRCSVSASVAVLPRGNVSNLGVYLQCWTTESDNGL